MWYNDNKKALAAIFILAIIGIGSTREEAYWNFLLINKCQVYHRGTIEYMTRTHCTP